MHKVKPKDIKVNLPAVHLFNDESEMASFASAVNTLIYGKVKIKYDMLGTLNGQYVGLFYIHRNDESASLRETFGKLIEQSELNLPIDEEDDQENIQPSEHHYLCDGCDEEILHSKELEHCGYCGGDWNHGKCEEQNQ